MEFHNSIPIPYYIWCKSLVADSDCVAILCSVYYVQTWLNILKVYLQYCAKL